MNGVIGVLDKASGVASHRPKTTLTLDVPHDLPESGVVFVDDGRRGRYVANDGKGVDYLVLLRPLAWRRPGEICLVARSGGALRRARQFRLSVVAPTPSLVEPTLSVVAPTPSGEH
jgi:hypothetical protein